jgi:hypothetical protein
MAKVATIYPLDGNQGYLEEWKFVMLCDALKSQEGRESLYHSAEARNDFEMMTFIGDWTDDNWKDALIRLRRYHFGQTIRIMGVCRGKLVKGT